MKQVVSVLTLSIIILFAFQNCGDPFNSNLSMQSNSSSVDAQKFQCMNPMERGKSNKSFLRLSKLEVQNVLNDLFGSALVSQVSDELNQFPADLNEKPSQFLEVLTSSHFDAMLKISNKLSGLAASNSAFVNKYSNCSNLNTANCLREFLTNFMPRSLRNSVPSTEIESLVTSYNTDSTVDAQVVIMSILLRPEFLMHTELGVENGQRLRLNDYEVASRISFQVIGSIPDETLWTAAQNGQLKNLEQVRGHVRRLLGTQRGRDKVKNLFRTWMSVEGTPAVAATPGHIKNIDLDSYYSSAIKDFEQFVEYIVFDKAGKFEDLFLNKSVFPQDQDLASVYGSSLWNNGEPQQSTSGHQGILLRPATLVGGENSTPIILRGVQVRTEILCDYLPVPNADVINARDDNIHPDEIDPLLNPHRDVVRNMTKSQSCMGCHSQINPLGFALEDFDSLGRRQQMEHVYDMNEAQVASFPVSSFALNPRIEQDGPQQLQNAMDLNTHIAQSKKVRSCFAEKLTEHIYKRNIASEDNCALSEKESTLHNKDLNILDVLTINVANEDIFWRAKE